MAPMAMRWVPSPNYGGRAAGVVPDMVVLHYTDMASHDAAVSRLCDPASKVSAHYLIAADGEIVGMVDEGQRAWHAGVSAWDGSFDINGRSIGIELDSPGHRPDPPHFPAVQIDALVRLLDDVRARWPIPARNVVAHSDIAPSRKIDPGERFPWQRLATLGHALAVSPTTAEDLCTSSSLEAALRAGGYAADETDPVGFADVVGAFHRRHLPHRMGEPADGMTLGTARAVAAAVRADRNAEERYRRQWINRDI